ncbi:MAG: endonuclease, partial [Bacteroidia bacterium]
MILFCNLIILLQGNAMGQPDSFSVMFYNVENLFDTIDSPLNDDEFLPSGTRRWGSWRYWTKLNSIYKVIVSGNEWSIPGIIGLCEVENQAVVNDLIRNTYLSRHPYKAVYAGGKDERGIGVAILADTS